MPVLDHEVHKLVKIDSNARYGCFNRKHYADSYIANGRDIIPYRMSRECRFDMSLTDAMCEGCKHRGSGERYNEMIRSQGA